MATSRGASPSQDPGSRLSWDDLRYLEAFGRLGTAGRVAREFGVSVSKVYRRIAHLEEAVGAPCVERGAGRLTEAGRALAEVGRETAASLAGVGQRLRHAEKALDGEVSLTTVDGFIPVVAPTIRELADRHPGLRISLHVGDQGPSVRRREVDIALAVVPKPPPGLWGKRLFTIRYGVYGTAAEVARAPRRWIVLGRPLHTSPQGRWEREHAETPVVRTASLPTILRLVCEGVGVAVLPRRLAATETALVEAATYASSLDAIERPAWLLTHPDLRCEPRVRAAMDALLAALA